MYRNLCVQILVYILSSTNIRDKYYNHLTELHRSLTQFTDTRHLRLAAIRRGSGCSWQRPVPDSASCSRECRPPVHTCLTWNEISFIPLTQNTRVSCCVGGIQCLPALQQKAKRFFSCFSYLDTRHSIIWDFFYAEIIMIEENPPFILLLHFFNPKKSVQMSAKTARSLESYFASL